MHGFTSSECFLNMNATQVIANLDQEIAARGMSPKGIIVNVELFKALHAAGRLSRKAGFPDFGFDFWALDQTIFVTVDPLLNGDFVLPPKL